MVKPKSRRGATVTRKASKSGAPRPAGGLLLLLPFTIIVLLVLSFVWGRVHVLQLAAGIGELQQQRQELLDRNEKLRVQIERLSSYGRISQIAAHGGLRQIRPQHLIVEN